MFRALVPSAVGPLRVLHTAPQFYTRSASFSRATGTMKHTRAQIRTITQNARPIAYNMPPNHPASVGCLETFTLPPHVTGSEEDRAMGEKMVRTWRRDGIFQIRVPSNHGGVLKTAFDASKGYFRQPFDRKAKHVDDQSFSGYIASGEELTDGIADYSEIFTVTKDLPVTDSRVQQKWPCHGPCPWPDTNYETTMKGMMSLFAESGEKILKLTALGLNLVNSNIFADLTEDGWHHMRILRFPQVDKTNGKGKPGRGIGSHTDYGLLVLAAQDHVGGLFVRPPMKGEEIRNWEKSAAGRHENDEKWVFVPPVENVLTVFPGDMMQYMTNDYLPSTPHKVGLNTSERYAFAYFHEPNFSSVIRPLTATGVADMDNEGIHYGTHFTNMCMRNYPERITAKRIRAENRLAILESTRFPSAPKLAASTQSNDFRQMGGAQLGATFPVRPQAVASHGAI